MSFCGSGKIDLSLSCGAASVLRYFVEDGVLQIVNVSHSDRGVYTCVARTPVDGDEASAVLLVLGELVGWGGRGVGGVVGSSLVYLQLMVDVCLTVFRRPRRTRALGAVRTQGQKCEAEMDPGGRSQQLHHRYGGELRRAPSLQEKLIAIKIWIRRVCCTLKCLHGERELLSTNTVSLSP